MATPVAGKWQSDVWISIKTLRWCQMTFTFQWPNQINQSNRLIMSKLSAKSLDIAQLQLDSNNTIHKSQIQGFAWGVLLCSWWCSIVAHCNPTTCSIDFHNPKSRWVDDKEFERMGHSKVLLVTKSEFPFLFPLMEFAHIPSPFSRASLCQGYLLWTSRGERCGYWPLTALRVGKTYGKKRKVNAFSQRSISWWTVRIYVSIQAYRAHAGNIISMCV
jgi:hypothetical protein